MIDISSAMELAFLDLEESFKCTWRTGKGARASIIEAFSQRDTPAYKYLGYNGSDGLRHVFGRSIPNNTKPSNAHWEDWVLNRIGLYYCTICKMVHDTTELNDPVCKEPAKDRSLNREEVSSYICSFLLKNPCVVCKEPDIVVLEFDHLDPSIKSFNIGDRSNKTLAAVQLEISKCRVLCANCHRRHTAKIQGHFKYLFSELLKE